MAPLGRRVNLEKQDLAVCPELDQTDHLGPLAQEDFQVNWGKLVPLAPWV